MYKCRFWHERHLPGRRYLFRTEMADCVCFLGVRPSPRVRQIPFLCAVVAPGPHPGLTCHACMFRISQFVVWKRTREERPCCRPPSHALSSFELILLGLGFGGLIFPWFLRILFLVFARWRKGAGLLCRSDGDSCVCGSHESRFPPGRGGVLVRCFHLSLVVGACTNPGFEVVPAWSFLLLLLRAV